MDKQLANYFFEETATALAFVVNEYNFAPPRLEINENINFAFVIFMGKNLAIECILDERENDITCKIARVISGKKTTHYEVDESGVRVREYLSKLIEQQGVRERIFTRVGELEFRERIKVTMSDFARMLRKHGQDILNDSPTVLE